MYRAPSRERIPDVVLGKFKKTNPPTKPMSIPSAQEAMRPIGSLYVVMIVREVNTRIWRYKGAECLTRVPCAETNEDLEAPWPCVEVDENVFLDWTSHAEMRRST